MLWRAFEDDESDDCADCGYILARTTSAKADNTDHSANYYLPGCRDFANKKFGSDPFLQGECVGILEGLSVLASDLDATFVVSRSALRTMAVVVRWFDQHPERWHEDFRA